jgi:rubrerythrin
MDELQAVKLAIQMEKKASLFYREAAEQTSDPQAKEVLMKFSEDEEKHGQYLQILVDNYYIKHNRFDIPDMAAAEHPISQDGLIYSKSIEELSRNPEPVMAAVDRFASAEGEAIKLYRQLAGETGDATLSRFFTKLADWEEKHLALLKKQAEAFKKK